MALESLQALLEPFELGWERMQGCIGLGQAGLMRYLRWISLFYTYDIYILFV